MLKLVFLFFFSGFGDQNLQMVLTLLVQRAEWICKETTEVKSKIIWLIFTNCSSQITKVLDQVSMPCFSQPHSNILVYTILLLWWLSMLGTIICHLDTQANHISYFYIPNNLAMTDMIWDHEFKTPTHLKYCWFASNSVYFFPLGAFNISPSFRAANTGCNWCCMQIFLVVLKNDPHANLWPLKGSGFHAPFPIPQSWPLSIHETCKKGWPLHQLLLPKIKSFLDIIIQIIIQPSGHPLR